MDELERQEPTVERGEQHDHPVVASWYENPNRAGSRVLEITTPNGDAIRTYNKQSRWFTVSSIDVGEYNPTARHKGEGTALLSKAKSEAERVGAEVVIASITTRESYELFKKVFGEQYVEAKKRGNFMEEEGRTVPNHGDTSAFLYYEVNASSDRESLHE